MTADELRDSLEAFMAECVYPAEALFGQAVVGDDGARRPPVLDELQVEAKRRGLWNPFLGRRQSELTTLVALTGRSPMLATDALNLATPNSENIKLLDRFGTAEQRATWLPGLLDGSATSGYCMTEPGVSGSDPMQMGTTLRRDGSDLVVDGAKHWCTGAGDPRCAVLVVAGVHDDGRHSLALVPADAPGVAIEGGRTIFGYRDGYRGGRVSITFDNVRVPATNVLGKEGDGLVLAQALLVPARLQHCMRLVGVGERSLELMCGRAVARGFDGEGVVQDWIAESRIRLEYLRALVATTANELDEGDDRVAAANVAMLKGSAPANVEWIVDKAIQIHGADGFSHETPLALLWTYVRTLRVSDGPDEVHRRSVARRELRDARRRVD
ncbi:MAG: acyl-CoA dehydrogenase family protein [Acidimicrobiia bacterium]